MPEFQGGVAGFISYDYVRRYEKLPVVAEDDLRTPDLFFYLFDEWAILDVKTETAYFITLPGSGVDPFDVKDKWMASALAGLNEQNFTIGKAVDIIEDTDNLDVSVTGPQFQNMVRDVQSYIKNDELFK